jgi:hypothetical protein
MSKPTLLVTLAAGVGLVVAAHAAVALADNAARSAPADAAKAADVGKRVIELPTKAVMAAKSGNVPAAADFVNPKVPPGRVAWHATLEAACAAARTSGKPVLLFQMMGKLDDQFC